MRAVLTVLALTGWAILPLGAARTQATPAVSGFVGNKESKVFHLPACRLVAKIKPGNKVLFANREDARKAEFTPCKVCLR